MRDTKVCVAITPSGGMLLLASLGSRSDTLVISVDQSSGELVHTGVPGHDVFPCENDALQMVRARLCGGKALPVLVRGHAFLGIVLTPVQVMVLVAVEVRRDQLPAGHSMCTVVKSQWVKSHAACSKFGSSLSKTDETGLERLREFAVSGHHFYSETVDLSRPFPSTRAPLDYDPEYCWNQWLASPFERAGLRNCCVVLLQGLGCSRTISCVGGTISLAIITRKSIANPGTRYNSRGLNEIAGAGNELESEQIVWAPVSEAPGAAAAESGGSDREAFSSHLWRRGTVPVHWRHELTSSVTAPKIVISENAYDGVDDFFLQCHERYGGLGMTFVNLLRCDTESGETGLSEVFQQALREARGRLAKRGIKMELSMCNFDWHRLKKEIGLQSTVRGLWDRTGPMLQQADLTAGCIVSRPGRGTADGPLPLNGCAISLERRQRALMRYNCADSLDRTNLCCFMVSQQLLLEQCRRLGVGLKDRQTLSELLPAEADLEVPWLFLHEHSFLMEHVRRAFEGRLIEWLAEAYVRNGDIFSQLYTSTPALATGAIREYTTLPPAQSDALISTQRRYHNVLGDSDRQCQYLLLLGRFLPKLLPCHQDRPRVSCCFSAPGAALLQPVPSETLPNDFVAQVLDAQASELGWISPSDIDVLDVCIKLRAPCTVTEVQLTVKNGISSCEFPTLLSIWVGAHVDSLTQVYGNVILPICDDGTRLSFPVPVNLSSSPARQLSAGQVVPETLVLPAEEAWWSNVKAGSLSQVVRVQFGRSPSSTRALIVGRISVLGQPAGGVGDVGDSGINLLANRKLADDALLSADSRPVGYESVGNMVEKKFADNASRTARELGGKALAKADEFVDRYAGDDSKLGHIAKGALSSISKLGGWSNGWMGAKKTHSSASSDPLGEEGDSQAQGQATAGQRPPPASSAGRAGQGLPAESPAGSSVPLGGMPEWMLGGVLRGAGKSGGSTGGVDVASLLAAQWGQQAASRAWGRHGASQQHDHGATAPGAQRSAGGPAPAPPAPAPVHVAGRAPAEAAASTRKEGETSMSALERGLMAESRGARAIARRSAAGAAEGADAPGAPSSSASSGARGAAASSDGAAVDPLGNIMLHGGKFGTAELDGSGGEAGQDAELDEFERMLLDIDDGAAAVPEPRDFRALSASAAPGGGTDVDAAAAAPVPSCAEAARACSAGPAEASAPAAADVQALRTEDTTPALAAPPASQQPQEGVQGAPGGKLMDSAQDRYARNDAAAEGVTEEQATSMSTMEEEEAAAERSDGQTAAPRPENTEEAAAAHAGAGVRADDAHVLRRDVCVLALAERRGLLKDSLAALRAFSEGVPASADLHREAIGGAEELFDGHNKGGRKTEGGRVAPASHESEAVVAAAAAVCVQQRVANGYCQPDAAASKGMGKGNLVSGFPASSVVMSVPTAAGSLPVESVLMNDDVLALEEGCWAAPEGVEEVKLHVCLAHRASVEQVELVVPFAVQPGVVGSTGVGASVPGGEGGFTAEQGMELRMTMDEYLVHGALPHRDAWVWDVAGVLSAMPDRAAAPGTVLTFRPPAAGGQEGRVLCINVRVSKGQALRLGRLRVWGAPAVAAFQAPPALVGSSECVAQSGVSAILQTRLAAEAIRGVRAAIREGGCGGMLGACNGEGLALDLVLEPGTPIIGLAIELRPSSRSGLPGAAGSAAAAMAAISSDVPASSSHMGTPVPYQPAEACLLVLGGGGGRVGGHGASDVRLDVRLPMVLAPSTLYYALPAPAVSGHVTLLLGRTYGGGWADKTALKHLGVQLYTYKLSET